jgi:hypothetical protein
LAIFLLLSFLLSLSPVQTGIASYITKKINEDKNTHISISKVDLSVFGKVAIEEILVRDEKLDTMFHVSTIRGNMDKLDLVTGRVKIDDLFLISPYLSIKIYENDTISNLDIFINKFKTKKDTVKAEVNFGFISTGINIKNLTFYYKDERSKKEQDFKLTKLDLVIRDVNVDSDNIYFSVDQLKFDINNNFKMKSLTGDFVYSPTYTQIENLHVVSENSDIKSNLKITYPSFQYVVKKSPEVKLDFSISPSTISLREINYFVPFTKSKGNIRLSMKAKGNIDRMEVSEFKMKTSKNTEINAQMDLHYILSKKNFDFNLTLYRLSSNYNDIVDILPKKLHKSVPPLVERLGDFDLTGKINFKKNYLNSNLDFETEIGELSSDIEIAIKDSIENADYKGEIKIKDFDLRSFLRNDMLGLAELDLNIEGKGLTLETLDSYIEGNVVKLDFNNYEYHNIVVKGDIEDKLFKGSLDIKDNNLDVSFSGLVDLRTDTPQYNFKAYIDNADLVKTNLFTRDSLAFLEGSISVNLEGKTVEDLMGNVGISNLVYQNENDLYYFDEFNLSSDKDGMHHKVVITSSDIVSGDIEGDFYFYDLPKMFENALGSFFNNYEEKDVVKGQNIDFQITIKDKIIEIFYPNINFKSGTSVLGSLDSETNHLQLKFNSDGINLNQNTIDSITLWVDNKSDFYNTLLKIKQIKTKGYSIHDLNLAVVNKLDSIELTTDFYGGDSLTEKYNFKIYETIDEESNWVFGFLNSQIDFMGNTWVINPENNKSSKVVYNSKTKAVEVDSIYIANGSQSILVHGHKDDSEQKYFAHVEDVVLQDLIREDAKFKFQGVMNADLVVSVEGEEIKPVANFSIDSLSFNSNYMGNLNVDMRSASNNGVYSTDISLIRNNINTLAANGIIDFSKGSPTLDINANLEKLRLGFINEFTKKLFSDIRGYASGEVRVSGSLNNPDLNGYLDLQRAGIAIDYLKVNLNIEGKQRVFVKDHIITVPKAILRDSEEGTRGVLTGTVKNFDNYKKWDLDLNVKADKLLALNTTEEDNPLYYGKVYTTGEIGINGLTSKLNFDVIARTEKGTVFSIPILNSKEASQSDFIYFTPPKEEFSEEELEELKMETVKDYEEDLFSGMQLSFNLEVTPDAQVEIVFDQQVGDVMKATGSGVLKMDIDTKGGFSMNGTYMINDGEYLFTMQNLINKKFRISRGSTIKWDGDPLEAILNIDAIYKTKTQVASYLDYGTSDSNKMLVELHLKLKEQILKPEIDFDIKMPDAESSLQSQLEMKLNESEEERSRQFIMLITLNSFATDAADIGVGGGIANSTAEMFANQFANVASGISDNVDISLGYSAANPNAGIDNVRDSNDELEVGVSSKLFDDRVTVNGNVGVPVGSSQTSIVGDVEVLVNLTKDGRYKGKMFSRQNVVTDLFESDGYTQGIGISYQTDFDSFKELWDNLFRRDVDKDESIVPDTTIKSDTIK